MIPKASNKNQKQAASQTLPFITQQQRAAVNNIIGLYLFLLSDLPNQRSPNKHWPPGWLLQAPAISCTSTASNDIHGFQRHPLLPCFHLPLR